MGNVFNILDRTGNLGAPHFGYAAGLAPHPLIGEIAAALTENRAYYARYIPQYKQVVNALAFQLGVASTSTADKCQVAIANSAKARIVASTQVTGKLGTAVGQKTVSIANTTLQAGNLYYLCFSCSTFIGVTPQLLMTSSPSNLLGTGTTSIGSGIIQGFQNSASTIPNPIVPNVPITNVPILAAIEA